MSLYFLSFGAGILSFLSPCVLPLIPGYISFINGTTLEGLEDKKKYFIFKETLLFTIGFSIVFVSLGATATLFGSTMLKYSSVFTYIVGIIIIFFSLNMKVTKNNFLTFDTNFFSILLMQMLPST